jgi:ABC-type cobalamin/Fe3+-siderophores transport system ATPase subunit
MIRHLCSDADNHLTVGQQHVTQSKHTAALAAHALECIRDDRTLFSNLEFRLEPGSALILEGRNGCGKTSLLRILCDIRLPDDGSVTWGETAIDKLGPDYHSRQMCLPAALPGTAAQQQAVLICLTLI